MRVRHSSWIAIPAFETGYGPSLRLSDGCTCIFSCIGWAKLGISVAESHDAVYTVWFELFKCAKLWRIWNFGVAGSRGTPPVQNVYWLGLEKKTRFPTINKPLIEPAFDKCLRFDLVTDEWLSIIRYYQIYTTQQLSSLLMNYMQYCVYICYCRTRKYYSDEYHGNFPTNEIIPLCNNCNW